MACLRPSYCYAPQKFGYSISAGSFIALISQSNAVGSRMNQCDVPHTFLTSCFFSSWLQASFTRSQSSSTSLSCHANICKSRGLFYVHGCNFFRIPKQTACISLTCMKDAKCLLYLTYTETDHPMWFWKKFENDVLSLKWNLNKIRRCK